MAVLRLKLVSHTVGCVKCFSLKTTSSDKDLLERHVNVFSELKGVDDTSQFGSHFDSD